MSEADFISHRSMIFTNHTSNHPVQSIQLFDRKSTNSLPHIKRIPKVKNQPKMPIQRQKARDQIIKQQRGKDLLRLKYSLDARYADHLDFLQQMKPKIVVQTYMPKRIELKMNEIMKTREEESVIPQKKDKHFEQFEKYCLPIIKVHQMTVKLKDYRIKNKLTKIINNMKCQNHLQNIVQDLTKKVPLYQLYKEYKKLFINDANFYKEMKIVGLKTMYMIDNYEKNRYGQLCSDIEHKTSELRQQKYEIGTKLQKIESLAIRKGIFETLENMRFDCLANRNYYDQIGEIVKNKFSY